jgi:hypothetical protein
VLPPKPSTMTPLRKATTLPAAETASSAARDRSRAKLAHSPMANELVAPAEHHVFNSAQVAKSTYAAPAPFNQARRAALFVDETDPETAPALHASSAAATLMLKPAEVEIDPEAWPNPEIDEVVGAARAMEARMAKMVSFLTMVTIREVLIK